MAKTRLTGVQILDRSVQLEDLDTTTPGQAVVTKIIAGTGVTLESTGVDAGTGNVTINATIDDSDHQQLHQKIETLLWMGF